MTAATLARVLVIALAASFATGCQPVHSTAVPNGPAHAPYRGIVRLRALAPADDEDPEELGLVQAVGKSVDIVPIADEFRRRVGEIGGNLGVVDTIRTKYAMTSRVESYSYSCSTTSQPRTCTGTRTVTQEIWTTSMVGRAFRIAP
jgi:hypothetical protein